MFARTMVLSATLVLACFAGTASADRLVGSHTHQIDGATVAARLFQQSGGARGLYVNVRLRNTRRAPGCINAAVRWVRPGRTVEDQWFVSPRRVQPFKTCEKNRWVNLRRTPVRGVAEFERIQTHVAVVGGRGRWKDLLAWNRAELKRKADRLMRMTSRDFLKYKRAALANRRKSGATKDNTWPLDWSDDGCSIPGQESIAIANLASGFFNAACQQHDFGYRNYGKHNLALDRTDDTREWIDDKMEVEATRTCENTIRDSNKLRTCKNTANIIWGAVRVGGSGAFYGLE